MTTARNITLALRQDDHVGVWRIYATRDGLTAPLCVRRLGFDDVLYRATRAAIREELRKDHAGAFWLTRDVAERAMAAAQAVLDMPDPTDGNHSGIACPWCGKVKDDLWEHGMQDEESREIECGWCGKSFSLLCRISVDYTATPIAPKGSPP